MNSVRADHTAPIGTQRNSSTLFHLLNPFFKKQTDITNRNAHATQGPGPNVEKSTMSLNSSHY